MLSMNSAAAPRRVGWSATRGAAPVSRAAAARPSPPLRTLAPVRAVASEAPESEAAEGEQFEYQAEVNRLLDLIVNSLYSNKEIFLRELVSNASDALDKIRFLSVTDDTALSATDEMCIKIRGYEENQTLVIEDTGIGMTRTELIDSLGTIARSGTAKFMEMMQQSQDGDNLIGRFGVGFYSSFLVADKVTVDTKGNADDKTWRYESSTGSSSYTITESPDSLPRGTRITLHLKDDATEFASDKTLVKLIKTYSEFINFPIEVWSGKQEPKQVEDSEATAKAKEQWEERKKLVEDKGEEFTEEEPKPVMKTEYEEKYDWNRENSTAPIWVRSPRDVEEAEYNEFYKGTFKEFLDPLAKTHFNVEGDLEFRAILFIPGMAPFDQQDMMSKSRNLKLFVRRVFISDQFDENLMPRYLSFVKGVVDSNDLPLNVSREILQESRVVRVMRKRLLKKTLDMIAALGKDEDKTKYDTFWDAFGRNIKLGIIEDQENRDTLAGLLRFKSSKSDDGLTTLDDYVERMKEDQKNIYFVAADSLEQAKAAPFLEGIVKRDLEVLYLLDPIDEVAVSNLNTYKDFQLTDVSKEDIDLGEDGKEEQEKAAEDLKGLTEWMKEKLGEKVESVKVSSRLADTPCVLVTSKFGWSANMERIMKAQAMGDNKALEYMKGRKIMEINPSHPIIKSLAKTQKAGDAGDAEAAMVALMFETSMLTSGFQLESPTDFARNIFDLMGAAIDFDEEEEEEPEEEAPKPSSGKETVDPEVV